MRRKKVKALLFTGMLAVSALLAGCSKNKDMDGKTVIEMVQYKQTLNPLKYLCRPALSFLAPHSLKYLLRFQSLQNRSN